MISRRKIALTAAIFFILGDVFFMGGAYDQPLAVIVEGNVFAFAYALLFSVIIFDTRVKEGNKADS
jgi:membrane associated rhomboid family serine protease